MAQNQDKPLSIEQEQLIFCLLREKTKAAAAEAARVNVRTMYRWLAEPAFKAAYRAARRAAFDDALAVLERNAERAAQRLADELDEDTAAGLDRSPLFINAASRLLDRAFKAQTAIAVEEELANLRVLMTQLQTGQPAAAKVAANDHQGVVRMASEEIAEACRLRISWMTLLGHPVEDIDHSLRYQRPQSLEEEKHCLEMVEKLLEDERRMEPPHDR